jgi:hypothetical protein
LQDATVSELSLGNLAPVTDIELLYQEYVRIAAVIDRYSFSSFGDFQLIAVVGAMLAWKPLADRLTKIGRLGDTDAHRVLLLGFIAIAAMLTILALRDLTKHSVIQFHLLEAEKYEAAIRSLQQKPGLETFRTASGWRDWQSNVQLPLVLIYRGFFVVVLAAFPSVVLLWTCPVAYVRCYVLVVILFAAIYSAGFYTIARNVL